MNEPPMVVKIGGAAGIDMEPLCREIAERWHAGEAAKDRLVTSAGARPGDRLLVTKGIAVEGTAALAGEAARALRAAGVDDAALARAAAFLERPGISVVPDARVLCDAVRPHAMHDATEGGLATALRELAEASGVGLRVEEGRMPVLPETQVICDALGLDPLGLLASGCLIAAVAPEDESAALAALAGAGVAAAVIGEATPAPDGVGLATATGEQPWPTFTRDELARYLEG